MSLRLARVNELIKREIGSYLSTRYGSETVRWTITSVDGGCRFANATVAYSVVGDELCARELNNFRRHASEIRGVVSKHIVLKYSPNYNLSGIMGLNEAIE